VLGSAAPPAEASTRGRAIEVVAAGRYLSIPKVFYDLKHLRPSRERAVINTLIFVNRHDELELFVIHFPLFGRPTHVAAAPAGAASPFEAAAAILAAPSFGGGGPPFPTGVGSRV